MDDANIDDANTDDSNRDDASNPQHVSSQSRTECEQGDRDKQELNRKLLAAAWAGDNHEVTTLLKSGADVNFCAQDGITALIKAADNDHTGTMQVLLEAGADLHHTEECRWTALTWAAREGHALSMQFLLERNGARNDKDLEVVYRYCGYRGFGKAINKAYRQVAGQTLDLRYFTKIPLVMATCGDSITDDTDEASADQIENVRTLQDVLNMQGIGKLENKQESNYIKSCVCDVIREVCFEMANRDGALRCNPVLAGSSANGTKTGKPDEFDFIFEIESYRSDGVKIVCTGHPGVVRVRNTRGTIIADCEDEGFVLVELKEYFLRRLCEAMACVLQRNKTPLKPTKDNSQFCEWNKVCITFNFLYRGDFYKQLPISVDATPSIKIEGAPPNSRHGFPEAVGYYHVVPKSVGSSEESRFFWSVCLSAAENHIILNLPDYLKQGTIAAKALLSPQLNDYRKTRQRSSKLELSKNFYTCEEFLRTHGQHDVRRLFNATRYQPKQFVDSYLLKVALLHVATCYQHRSAVGPHEVVAKMLDYIESCVEKNEMPHPLIEDFNVLAEDKYKVIEDVPARYLRGRCVTVFRERLAAGQFVQKDGALKFTADELWPHMETLRRISSDLRGEFFEAWTELSQNSDSCV